MSEWVSDGLTDWLTDWLINENVAYFSGYGWGLLNSQHSDHYMLPTNMRLNDFVKKRRENTPTNTHTHTHTHIHTRTDIHTPRRRRRSRRRRRRRKWLFECTGVTIISFFTMEKDPTESEKLSWLLVRRLLGTTWSMDVKGTLLRRLNFSCA